VESFFWRLRRRLDEGLNALVVEGGLCLNLELGNLKLIFVLLRAFHETVHYCDAKLR